ncbi:hypothetical protein BMETH_1581_1 [methanotrophic bacterial endosymbiont of Bathymodiolus sp.]|nr:hypothetical protein BMETH_1581_1 [methanotrophic bacterial endosymbiont of Bathymodiolus sp.]
MIQTCLPKAQKQTFCGRFLSEHFQQSKKEKLPHRLSSFFE